MPDNLVWAANDTFPALGQRSFHTCRHLYAGRRVRALSPHCDPAPWPSPPKQWVGSSNVPDIGFRRGPSLDASSGVRSATARAVARPPGPIRPGETSLSGRRGLFYPSFPAEGHPPRESDIATRRPGADTVTGLSPVGALPLQAARFGEGQVPRYRGASGRRNVPSLSWAKACRSSSWVFMTIGPYQATGSLRGWPETSRNRIPSSPV